MKRSVALQASSLQIRRGGSANQIGDKPGVHQPDRFCRKTWVKRIEEILKFDDVHLAELHRSPGRQQVFVSQEPMMLPRRVLEMGSGFLATLRDQRGQGFIIGRVQTRFVVPRVHFLHAGAAHGFLASPNSRSIEEAMCLRRAPDQLMRQLSVPAPLVRVFQLPPIPTALLTKSLSSTLRFSARPNSVSFDATGFVSLIAPGATMFFAETLQSCNK